MGLSGDVIRFMTIRLDELEEKPSAMMRRSDERSDRGDRGDRGDRDRGDRGDRRPPRRDRPERGGRPEFSSEGDES
jgi:small subunit ribosomal protein S6